MKTKISITIEESTEKEIEVILQDSLFRNKSHFLEYAAKKLLERLK